MTHSRQPIFWTAAMDAVLEEEFSDSTDVQALARRLGVSKSSAYRRAEVLGLQRPLDATRGSLSRAAKKDRTTIEQQHVHIAPAPRHDVGIVAQALARRGPLELMAFGGRA